MKTTDSGIAFVESVVRIACRMEMSHMYLFYRGNAVYAGFPQVGRKLW